MTIMKSLENRLRLKLDALGYRLFKSRRDGAYMILDCDTRFALDDNLALEGVQDWLTQLSADKS